jgi:hypothetical protein
MAPTDTEVLFPLSLVLPSIPVASQLSSAKTGTIGMSGANLVFFNGTNWKIVTAP